jgi:hypothetical protein
MIARWPDYVLRGAVAIVLLFVLVRVFGAGDAPTTISPTPVAQQADPAERDLLASVSNPNAVWEKVAFVLRRLGYLDDNATATEADIRSGLKRYQHTVALLENGILSREVLARILDERMVLTPYMRRKAEAHGRWFLTQAGADCSISTGAVRVEGRVLATRMPALRMVANQSRSDGALEISFGPEDLFDTSKSLIVSGEGADLTLKPNGTLSGGAARDLIRSLRSQKDDVLIEGASLFGGPLRLRFSTLGFDAALAALGARCGDHFIEN